MRVVFVASCLLLSTQFVFAEEDIVQKPAGDIDQLLAVAGLSESMGQIDEASAKWRRIVETGSFHVYEGKVKIAARKLCKYDSKYCERSQEPVSKISDPVMHEEALKVGSLLKDINGINIQIVNGRIVIDGQVTNPWDFRRVHAVVTLFEPAKIANLVTFSPLTQKLIAHSIANDLNTPEVTTRSVDNTIILEGVVPDQKLKDQFESIARAYTKSFHQALGTQEEARVLNLIQLMISPPTQRSPAQQASKWIEK